MTDFTLAAQRPALLKGFDNEFHILAKLKAPEQPEDTRERKPLNLSIVIDRSGSMSGQPLEEAKKCASMIVNSLKGTDRISVITYDDNADVVVSSTKAVHKTEILRAIERIRSGGMTDLHSGWLLAAEQVARYKTENSINRVLLLSDGMANTGLTDQYEINSQCSELAETGVTTSTYGLGEHFNERLMVEMGRAGRGQSYYGQKVEDLEDPFREEFDLLSNTIASKLEIFVEYPDFVKLELLNNYNGRDPLWKMPDLAYGGEAWALFKLTIKEGDLQRSGRVDILRSHISYEDINGERVQTPIRSIRLRPVNENAFGALVEDPVIRTRIQEVRAASLQDVAREAADRGDWGAVEVAIKQAEEEAIDNAWIRENLKSLRRYAAIRERNAFSKEAMYSADKFRSRLSSSIENSRDYSVDEENIKPMYLRRKEERGKRM
jgi:Ca-activated chloride channel family protein